MSGLLEALDGDPAVDRLVSDAALVEAMVDVEVALVRALARAGIAPPEAADAVAAARPQLSIDVGKLGERSVESGTPVLPLVTDLVASVPEAVQPWVHYGATSQDIVDTALMLVARDAVDRILGYVGDAASGAARLAETHAATLQVGRTLGQQAEPTTFGVKAAGWFTGLDRAWLQLRAVRERELAVQLGGATGTLAALGEHGFEVAGFLAGELGLAALDVPWHTERSRVHRLAAALGAVTTAAGKVATDVIWLSQSEVAEVAEGGGTGHGASSAMPHKRNPTRSVLTAAAAKRAPFLVGTVLGAGVHEHERAVGSWHAEWQPLRELIRLAGGAASRTHELLATLQVDAARMRANVDAAGDVLMAGSIATRLAASVGRSEATSAVRRAVEQQATGRTLREALLAEPVVVDALGADGIAAALDPAACTGSARAIIDRTLARHRSDDRGAEKGGRLMSVALAYDVHGPADAPVLVLGSSLGTSRSLWDEQLPGLAASLRVVRYDHRGHGESPVPAGPYTIEALADDLVALLDRLGMDRVSLGGLSLGGMVAMHVAARHPDRVERLVLVCTSAYLPPADAWLDRARRVRTGGMKAVVDAVTARWFTPAFASAQRAAELRTAFADVPAEGYASCCEAVAAMDLRPVLGAIRAPALVIAGDSDPATPPEHAHAIADGIAAGGGSATVALVHGAHLANVEDADAVTAAMLGHLTADDRPGDDDG